MPSFANMDSREKDAFEQNAKSYAAGTDPATNVISPTSTALTVAGAGTDYGLQVDESATSAVTGVKLTPAAAGAGVALSVIGGNASELLSIDAKGSGIVNIARTSTGVVNIGTGAVLLSTVTIAALTNIVAGGLNVAAGGATVTGQTTIVSGGFNVGAGGATITGQTKVIGPNNNVSLIVTPTTNIAGATIAPLNVIASTASQAVLSISGVFISTASINLAANKTAFIVPIYHETQRVWGYLAASIGVS